MSNFTKAELYNAVVDIYRKTGQGLPKLRDWPAVDELVSDGLVKVITIPYGHLPDDVTICLTKGYCVEENMTKGDNTPLTCMRIYMGIDPIIELGKLGTLTLKQAIQDPDIMSKYAEWLKTNQEALKEIETIEYIQDTAAKLSNEIVTYLKTRDWYTRNDNVAFCIEKLLESNENKIKTVKLLRELIELKESEGDKYKEELIKDRKELEDTKLEIENRKEIEKWLLKQDPKKKIQELID